MKQSEPPVQKIAGKVKRYLLTMMGRTLDHATNSEIYLALSWAMRDELLANWIATTRGHEASRVRMLYYVSLEWLPGGFFGNALMNVATVDWVKAVLKSLNRDYKSVMKEERDPGLGNGGLGRLASCFLDSLATHHYPAMGYGLRYQYGIFEQELWFGLQMEKPDVWLFHGFPWEIKNRGERVQVKYRGRNIIHQNSFGEEVGFLADYETIRAVPYDLPIVGYAHDNRVYSVLSLRLWTTNESPRNFQLESFNEGDLKDAMRNLAVTDVLYPNDKNDLGKFMRIKQEYLLVAASLQDILRRHFLFFGDVHDLADKIRIQMNDTHAALMIPEFMRILTEEYGQKWSLSWDIVTACCSYTNHTILPESLERWDRSLLERLFPRQMRVVERINWSFCQQVRKKFPGEENRVQRMSIIEGDYVRMAHLAIVGSHAVNGVSALHTKILKENLFRDFKELFPDLFINVTNGVSPRKWLLLCNPRLAQFISRLIGRGWIADFTQISRLSQFAGDPGVQQEVLSIKFLNKREMIQRLADIQLERYKGAINVEHDLFMDGDALCEVCIKRFHEYKRQLMKLLQLIMVYNDIREGNPPKIKRQVIMGGKAAPGYYFAKMVIRAFYILSRKVNTDPEVGNWLKINFVENYDVSKAEFLIRGADLSHQISTAGFEASGTSNMKLAMNGALTIGTNDGANIELAEAISRQWFPFTFGYTADELRYMRETGNYDPRDLIQKDAKIKKVIDVLMSNEFTDQEPEQKVLHYLVRSLTESRDSDRFYVLGDLRSFYETHKKVDELYLQSRAWAKHVIYNIAGTGRFSSDVSIKKYVDKIWEIKPHLMHHETLRFLHQQYENIHELS